MSGPRRKMFWTCLLCLVASWLTGCSETDDPAVTVVSHSQTGTELTVNLQSQVKLFNIWSPECRSNQPKLFKKVGNTWVMLRDERPLPGSTQRFYVDGVLKEECSLGCDGGNSCYEGALVQKITTVEYVRTGTKRADGPTCFSTVPADVPDIATVPTTGPYELELTFMPNGCDFKNYTTVRLPIPAK